LVYFRYGVISLFTSDPQVAYYASIRLCHVLLFQVLASSYEISGGCLRGLGYSLTPAVLTIFGTCVLRLLWVFTVDAHYHSFDILMTVYPLSWIVTGSAVLIAYAILSKRAYRS
jgi:Na+-driven multidrug efflux pump